MADSEVAQGPGWVRLFAVAVVAFAVFELAARAFFLVWAGKPFESTAPYVWSPYGLVRNNPALTSPQFQINANGFRNLETFQRIKPPGTFRVMLLGGSVLYAGLAQEFMQDEGRVDSGNTIARHLHDLMAADPDLKGVRFEIINAAVNFNRIVEVSSAYLAEYAFWEPDLVLVFGSANNFLAAPTRVELRSVTHNIQGDHPWRLEFERVVNEKNLAALIEHAMRVAADNLAGVALLQKLIQKIIDRALTGTKALAIAPSRPPIQAPADLAGEERYFQHYAAFADAMIAAARRHEQDIAFFWEYFLADLDGLKELSPQERQFRPRLMRSPADTAYSFRMRDRWANHFNRASVTHIDPLNRLRAEKGTVFIDYLHYTRHGNRLMAEVTHQAIKPLVVQRLPSLLKAEATRD